ncbi:tetratricopeptide repeat protein [Luteimonas sp. MC1572]|uniref:tetratricopeptide repeat protein n=1 Tax=Luteimonas sp. MC1572 TaxID=2799325 RepID=UPI0018F06CF4|nr:tetratricopeptide repeat protein [Luteimonas sp. MC1572]MBJ6980450.1 tetratricopeptide repeat protein [Luteimonas sp. MC1572]QQO04330.1 tetratricopeptide repeat protein [Luteimonas sp. MC1572]
MADDARIYRFGDVEVDTGAHRVMRGGRPVALEPKAYAVLLVLLAHPGHAIPRDELLDHVWGHRHVTPGVLNRVVAQLRKALGDDAEHPRYIQTLHAVGYRFMCVPDVHPAAALPAAEEISDETSLVEISSVHDVAEERGAGRSPWLRVAGVAMLLVIIATAWWRLAPPEATGPNTATIALRPFSMLGGSAEDAWFAEGLAVEMHDALAAVPGLKVAALMDPADPRRDVDVRELGRMLDVRAVLDASVRRDGDRVRINARLSDTGTGYVLWSRSYEHAMSELFDTQGAIAGEVVESMLGAVPAQRESLRQRLAPTRSVAAFEAYLRGIELARTPLDRERSGQAADAFRAALAADAGFARAQAALCATETRRFEYWNDAKAHERALVACRRALEMVPVPPEASLALGNLLRVDGEFDKAQAHFEAASRAPASAALAHVGLGKIAAARGDAARSRQHFDQALALAPENAQVHAEIGYQAYRDGRLEDAKRAYRRALELDPDNAGNWNTLGFLHLLAGEDDDASRAFERSIAITPSADVLANFALLRGQAGDHEGAVALYRRALELDPDDYINWGNLADGLRASGAARAEVRAAYMQAEQRVRRYLGINKGDGYAQAALGWYCANLGKREEALELVRNSRATTIGDRAEIALYNAESLAMLGMREASRQALERARAAGISEARIRASPVLE